MSGYPVKTCYLVALRSMFRMMYSHAKTSITLIANLCGVEFGRFLRVQDYFSFNPIVMEPLFPVPWITTV